MRIVLKSSKSNQELTMPVTPPGFQLTAGRLVEGLDMAQTGQVNLPGLQALFSESLEFLLPGAARNYTVPGYGGNPYSIVEQLIGWSRAGEVLRMIVTDTPVNVPVLLGPVLYRESGGAGDVTVTLDLREYRELGQQAATNPQTQNRSRPAPPARQPESSHTVVKGDTLWGICRKQYGDGALAYKVAAANGIQNANLIFPGQVVRLPDRSQL